MGTANQAHKRILILGADGMLGSAATHVLSEGAEVFAGVRSQEALKSLGIGASHLGVSEQNLLAGFDAQNPESVLSLFEAAQPDIVLNAVGIISQTCDAANYRRMLEVNSVWPHALAQICEQWQARLIHLSTDCVFSGLRGNYTENDMPDATDMYGRSKLLGEITESAHAITLRTSIIGWQFGSQVSLAGWFASHRDEPLKGYSAAIFSGLTTKALCEAIRDFVLLREELTGLYQVSARPIDKYSLLQLLAEKMKWNVDITPDDSLKVNKSLDSSRFQEATGWKPPSWDSMLEEMSAEYSRYYC